MLSNEIAISVIAKKLDTPLPRILSFLKKQGLISPETTAEGLLLTPQMQEAVNQEFGKGKGFEVKPVSPTPVQPHAPAPAVQTETFVPKTPEDLAAQWGITVGELTQTINITALAQGVIFSGWIDADWENWLFEARSVLIPEKGGQPRQNPAEERLTPEEYILLARKRNEEKASEIQLMVQASIEEETNQAIGQTGEYLGAVSLENRQQHETVAQGWVANEAATLKEIYDRRRLQRAALVHLAYTLKSEAEEMQKAQANLPSSWQQRLGKLGELCGRTAAIAIAPVASPDRNASSIIAALAASNRP